MARENKLLVVQVAGLGYSFTQAHGIVCRGAAFHPMETVFPAVTCPVQASFRTASEPVAHDVLANGFYDHTRRQTAFWEQSSALVHGARIWESFRSRGHTVGMLFWQQSLGESVDVLLSPAPIHKHHGGMIESCYSRPAGLYDRLCRAVGRPFRLANYWGPCASARSSQWIAEATAALLRMPDVAPDVCLTYLPALDYDLQRHGPEHPSAARAARELKRQIALLDQAAADTGYDLLIFGDYAISSCSRGPVFPNRVLREAGFMVAREVRRKLYPDFHASRAFALCDHEIAQVYVRDAKDVEAVRERLASMSGVRQVLVLENRVGASDARAAQMTLVADEGHWMAYPWWKHCAEAPDYAAHVDIHNKPGYDPCELLWGWPPGTVSQNPRRIGGSHGRTGIGARTCWASTVISGNIVTLIDLAGHVKEWMERA